MKRIICLVQYFRTPPSECLQELELNQAMNDTRWDVVGEENCNDRLDHDVIRKIVKLNSIF